MEWEEFRRYLQRRFKRGMSWDNLREWTVDHVLPVCVFDLAKQEQRAMVCHWSNLRPLWAEENRRKNGHFSKVELRLYKRLWRMKYKPTRQGELFKEETRKPGESRSDRKPICPF
jgi:hypothetical protein